MAFPITDGPLVPYSTNWNDRLTSSPTKYGVTEEQAEAYTAVHLPYVAAVAALQAARQAGVQSKPLQAARSAARSALLEVGRELYSFVQANRSVPDEFKIELGVTVIDREPTPVPIPATQPVIGVKRVLGRNLELSVRPDGSTRARPIGTIYAQLFYHIGEAPPASVEAWKWLANVGRSSVVVAFPTDVPAGAKVWLTGMWVNSRKESGLLSEPISTHLGGGVSQAA